MFLCKFPFKIHLVVLLSTIYRTNISIFSQDTESLSETVRSWTEVLNTLKYCTVQVFYHKTDFPNMDIVSGQLENLNYQLNFNFLIENVNDSKNRYVLSNSTATDYRGLIPNFPFSENKFIHIYSNCQVAVLFSPPVSLIRQLLAMSAFNEDPNYILIIDRAPEKLFPYFGYYFKYFFGFRVTSIILHFNTIDIMTSIVCHTCTPPQLTNDKRVLMEKFITLKKRDLVDLPQFYKRLTKNLNQHFVTFIRKKYGTLWEIPCSFRHCGLDTPSSTCPISEIKIRLNVTLTRSVYYIVGDIASENLLNYVFVEALFTIPGRVSRYNWMKYDIVQTQVGYRIYALPIEINAEAFLNTFDSLTCSVLFLLGSCVSLVLFKNKKFVSAPLMWTVSIFLQQGTNIFIQPKKDRVTKLRDFVTYFIIVVWLFNAFIVGSMFSGEFYSIFTSNRVPKVPTNFGDLLSSKNIDIFTASSTIKEDNNHEMVSYIMEMFLGQRLSTRFQNLVSGTKTNVKFVGSLNKFSVAYILDHKIFAVVDTVDDIQEFDTLFGVFKKYFIIPNKEANLGTTQLPSITSRTMFGVNYEENLGYLVESGVLDYWRRNYSLLKLLLSIKVHHMYYARNGNAQKNYTNYYQKIVLASKEKNSVDLFKEGVPIGVSQIKILFLIYAICVGISTSVSVLEHFRNFSIANLSKWLRKLNLMIVLCLKRIRLIIQSTKELSKLIICLTIKLYSDIYNFTYNTVTLWITLLCSVWGVIHSFITNWFCYRFGIK